MKQEDDNTIALNEIKNRIENWNQIRNTDIALEYLTSGAGFTIDKEDFVNWEKLNPKTLNCYIGINEFMIEFYLVDNITDENQTYLVGENLVKKAFVRSLSRLIPKPSHGSPIRGLDQAEADARIVNWILSSKYWFETQKEIRKDPSQTFGEMARLFTVPFSDLQILMKNLEPNTSMMAIMAMKDFEDVEYKGYNLELILGRTKLLGEANAIKYTHEVFEDLSSPRPPFGLSPKFNLLR